MNLRWTLVFAQGTHTDCAFTNIPAAILPVTNWQEIHSFQTMWQLPPMWPSAVTNRCHLFPIHHNLAQTSHFHLPLTEYISHLRTFKCLKSLSWRLSKLSGSLLLDALQRATCQEFAGVSTEQPLAVGFLTLVEACTVFLSYSQHTQPPSLFTNFSQESLWKLAVGTDTAAKRDVLHWAKSNQIQSTIHNTGEEEA